MRVLHVLEALRGGTSRHVLDVVRNVDHVEHHVVVPPLAGGSEASGAAVDEAAVEEMRRAGAFIHVVDMRRAPHHPVNLAAAARLSRLRRTVGASVVHGHSSIGGALARICVAGSRCPAIYTPNGLALGRAARLLERSLRPFTSRLVAVSQSEGMLAVDLGAASPDQVVVIANGIDLRGPDPVDLRAHLGLGPDTPLVGTVARLVHQKAPENFAAVCATVSRECPEAHFVLIGMGPLQDQVDATVDAADLRGRWHQIPRLDDAAAAIPAFDVFVLTSRFEGGPYAPLEAIRARVPVVLSDVVGNRDVVVHGVTGLLAPFGDTTTMGSHVLTLLEDGHLRDQLVCGGAERLTGAFDVRVMGRRLGELYQQVAAA